MGRQVLRFHDLQMYPYWYVIAQYAKQFGLYAAVHHFKSILSVSFMFPRPDGFRTRGAAAAIVRTYLENIDNLDFRPDNRLSPDNWNGNVSFRYFYISCHRS
jgi:hypothetical protein